MDESGKNSTTEGESLREGLFSVGLLITCLLDADNHGRNGDGNLDFRTASASPAVREFLFSLGCVKSTGAVSVSIPKISFVHDGTIGIVHNALAVDIAVEEVSGVEDTSIAEEFAVTHVNSVHHAHRTEASPITEESGSSMRRRITEGELAYRCIVLG